MMRDMMPDMMWGMGFAHLIVIVVVLLAIAALVKYVFFVEAKAEVFEL